MDTRREIALKKISEKFTTLSDYLAMQNKIGHNDINKSAERLFKDILNNTYSLNLQDMNAIQINYPAIDLGDAAKKICFQITSESTNKKFKDTLKKFKEHQLEEKFEFLVFLIISNSDKCTLSDPDVNTNVINLIDLYQKISTLDDKNIYWLEEYLKTNLIPRSEGHESILPNRIDPNTSNIRIEAFVRFLNLEREPELVSLLLSDIEKLAQMLGRLTVNQREYIFYIVCNGDFAENNYGFTDKNSVFITASELVQVFNSRGREIFDVLRMKNLVSVDDEYDPQSDGNYVSIVRLHYHGKLDDIDLFANIKNFCKNNEGKLRQIFLEFDFTCLSG